MNVGVTLFDIGDTPHVFQEQSSNGQSKGAEGMNSVITLQGKPVPAISSFSCSSLSVAFIYEILSQI